MKILFVNNGITHYYNGVLNRLNALPGSELILVIPKQAQGSVGAGVYQTREGVSFRVLELEEGRLLGRFPVMRGLAATLLRERPQIMIIADDYSFGWALSPANVLLQKSLGIKLIMKSIPFRLRAQDEELKSPESLLKRTALVGLRRYVFNLPDAHVNYVDDAFRVYGSYGVPKRKIFVTRNSPDTDAILAIRERLLAQPPILPPSNARLIHVGRLVEWKRVDMLIRALGKVRESIADAELVVVGSGTEEPKLNALARELGLEACVRFVGPVHKMEELGKYFMASTVYVLAGMGGLSINDAMCFGRPIICSICDGTEKALVRDGENGLYFEDGNQDDLTSKITRLLSQPELARKMGERSHEIIINEVNIHTVINGYARSFEYVLNG